MARDKEQQDQSRHEGSSNSTPIKSEAHKSATDRERNIAPQREAGAFERLALWSPHFELIERDNQLVVRADLPGLNKDDVTVEVDDGILTISGEQKQEREEKREGYYRSEQGYGRFFRAIPLPEGVDAEHTNASFDNGVLEVSFPAPKRQQRTAKRIPVR
jgi:HSP20 family protein